MQQYLLKNKIIDGKSIEVFNPRTRDVDNLTVYRCTRTGVIFIGNSSLTKDLYYEAKSVQNTVSDNAVNLSGKTVYLPKNEDAIRRSEQFLKYITGKRWLDVGTGDGSILDILKQKCIAADGVEPNDGLRKSMQSRGLNIFSSISDISHSSYDVISLFHVLEHLHQPCEALADLKKCLVPGGKIIIEVPHAKDFLMNRMELDSFKNFTLWSEHLVLHTKESLRKVLRMAGYKNIKINGFQRYNLGNHLYWIRYNLPGGHAKWPEFGNAKLHKQYEDVLKRLDMTDTLIAIAEI